MQLKSRGLRPCRGFSIDAALDERTGFQGCVELSNIGFHTSSVYLAHCTWLDAAGHNLVPTVHYVVRELNSVLTLENSASVR
jgi:hypothetical protein